MKRLTPLSLPWPLLPLVLLAVLFTSQGLVRAQSADETPGCPDAGVAPVPTAVAVTKVPIVVTSTTDDYFVLYVKHTIGGAELAHPVLVKLGEDGTTALAENVQALPAGRYRVEKYSVSDPADVDGDCVDDITELNDLGNKNPINPAEISNPDDGAVVIKDKDAFNSLARYKETKAVIYDLDTSQPRVYFIDTNTHPAHYYFKRELGLDIYEGIGVNLYYRQLLINEIDGSGLWYFKTNIPETSNLSFAQAERIHTLLAANIPALPGALSLYVPSGHLREVQSALPDLRNSRIPVVFDDALRPNIDFIPMNVAVGYGLLKFREPDDRPHPREIAIYETLPNELPLVAGLITTVSQTPLSHVNLRALQNGIPNAFIRNAREKSKITDLVGSYVRYEVTVNGWKLRAATPKEIETHYQSSRPAQPQTPQRDLSVTKITPLNDIGFSDWKTFGVKAANLAELRKLKFPEGTVPNGFAIPFYFYDEFMNKTTLGEETVFGKGKGAEEDKFTLQADAKLIDAVKTMLAHPKFQADFDIQEEMLDDLRDAIKDAESPQWIIDALTAMHETFPKGTSLRYRSSTNNEDLPRFNGAGLYDSKTQKPKETEKDGIDKSFKQVIASLWTLRAFTEREFHRVDHLSTAMGVLVHPNFSDEKVNGVGVSFNPIYGTSGIYYVNSQIGEDLITNPEAHSVPEEILLNPRPPHKVVALSNQVPPGQLLMTDDQLTQLWKNIRKIHNHFKSLYKPDEHEPFAMEIEFKITSENVLAIKQARPWVFPHSDSIPTHASLDPEPGSVNLNGQWQNFTLSATGLDSVLVNMKTLRGAGSLKLAQGNPPPATGKACQEVGAHSGYSMRDGATFSLMGCKTGVVVIELADEKNPSEVLRYYTVTVREQTETSSTVPPTLTPSPANAVPVFTDGAAASRSVAENTDSGRSVGSPVSATDADGDTLTYTLGGRDAASFGIDGNTGQLRTSSALDHEAIWSYVVTVTASDGNGGSATITVNISVADVDEAPGAPAAPAVTADGSSSLSGSWSAPTNTGPAISGYDVRYKKSTDTDWTDWPHTGTATSANITGLDAGTDYDIQVRARNAEGTGLWSATGGGSTTAVREPIPPQAPEPTPEPFEASFHDVPAGHDGGGFVFELRLSEGVVGLSYRTVRDSLVQAQGANIVKARRLVAGRNQRWEVTVRPLSRGDVTLGVAATVSCDDAGAVCAGDGRMLTALPSVTVLGPDAPPPLTANAVPFFSDGAVAVRSVAENTASGQAVGLPVAAGDPDGDSLAYTLGGVDAASFGVDSGTGQLRTSSVLDYEARALYAVTVTASDGRGGSVTIPVSITVTDVDEAPGAPAAPLVSADGSGILVVSWSAPTNTGPAIDDYDVRYRRSADTDWTDWPHSGIAASTVIFGLEVGTEYDIQVRARNAEGTSPWSATGSGSTEAAPERVPPPSANAVPVFAGGAGTSRSVAENTTSGQAIGSPVAAGDPDGDPLTYTLGGVDAASFVIDAGTGQLRTSSVLDYETQTSYTMTVTASDGRGGNATIGVTIGVTDTDEAPGQPGAPAVSAASASSLSVSWSASTNTGPPISSYDLRYRKSTQTDWAHWPHTGVATSATITGLDTGTDYDIQIRASNAEGTSPWSATSSATTGAAPTPGELAAPHNLAATVIRRGGGRTPNIIALRWDNPHNAAIAGYQYRLKPDTDNEWEQWQTIPNANANTTSSTIWVRERADFQVELRAINQNGKGASTQTSFTTTPPG